MTGPLLRHIEPLPPAVDQAAVKAGMDDLKTASPALVERIGADLRVRNLISAAFGGSSYLRQLIVNDPQWTLRCLESDPRELLRSLCIELARDGPVSAEETMMRYLRKQKSKAALLLSLADLAGAMTIIEITQGLTDVADAIVRAAVD